MAAFERSVESGAKQRIGDDIVTLEQSEIERLDRHRAGTAFLPCASRIAAQALGRNDARDFDLEAGMLGERCQNVTVAAVVSATAQDQDPLRLWPTCAQRAQRRLTCARHQRKPGNTQRVDRVAVDCAHLSGGIKNGRKTGHGDDYTDAAKRLRVSGTASQP